MPASKARNAATADRRARAVALRLAGVDYETIASQLGYASRGAATKDVCRALEANRAECAEAVENLREADLLRLDRMLMVAWNKVIRDGNLRAVEVVLKIMERRAKLVGLDAKIEMDVKIETETDREIRALVDRLSRTPATRLDELAPGPQATPAG